MAATATYLRQTCRENWQCYTSNVPTTFKLERVADVAEEVGSSMGAVFLQSCKTVVSLVSEKPMLSFSMARQPHQNTVT